MKKLIHLLSLGLLTSSYLYHTSMTMKHNKNLENYEEEGEESTTLDFKKIENALSILGIQKNETVEYAYNVIKNVFESSRYKSIYMTKSRLKQELQKINDAYQTLKTYNLENKRLDEIENLLYEKALSVLKADSKNSLKEITENYDLLLQKYPSNQTIINAYHVILKMFKKEEENKEKEKNHLKLKEKTEKSKILLEQIKKLNEYLDSTQKIALTILGILNKINNIDLNHITQIYFNYKKQYEDKDLDFQDFKVIENAYKFLLNNSSRQIADPIKVASITAISQVNYPSSTLPYSDEVQNKLNQLEIPFNSTWENVEYKYQELSDYYENKLNNDDGDNNAKKELEEIREIYNYLKKHMITIPGKKLNENLKEAEKLALGILEITTSTYNLNTIKEAYLKQKESYKSQNFREEKLERAILDAFNFLEKTINTNVQNKLALLQLAANSTWEDVEKKYKLYHQRYTQINKNDEKLKMVENAYNYLKEHMLKKTK